MIPFAFKLPQNILEQARVKAGLAPLGKVVRILVLKWLAGEIVVTKEDEQKFD